MKHHSTVQSAVRQALCVGAFATAAGYAPAVVAQGADGEELEEITVTGTRTASNVLLTTTSAVTPASTAAV